MKAHNEHKFCFIICTNKEQQLEECLMYLNLLEVPAGYEVEVLTVTDADSMAAGYNSAMNASDARYKIYLHQDTFIVKRDFLSKVLQVFHRDREIGMLGIIGTEHLSKDGVMWHAERCGNFYRLDEMINQGLEGIVHNDKLLEVEAIDGFLMATREDLPWREDLFDGFDFYDVSQCMEFRRAGYKIVVPNQRDNWVIHATDGAFFWNYEKYRAVFMKQYSEMLQKSYLRVLFLHSNHIYLGGLIAAFLKLGHEVDSPEIKVDLEGYSEQDVEAVEELLEEGHYDLVSSFDFCPSISQACQNMGVKYFAWVYDSPLLGLYREQARNECNYISVFDRKQYERLQMMHIPHLYYIPLAADVEVFGNVVVHKKDERKYKADIAFVGRLYAKRGFEELFDQEGDGFLREANTVIDSVKCIWNRENTIYNKASKELVEYAVKKESPLTWKQYHIDKKYYFESMRLARKCNETERVAVLTRLSGKYRVRLYTDDSSACDLPGVQIKPWVDYWSEMPKVFYISKINLNITSRSIESGIPQRVWDIMAVGGFCLTNYQPELEEYFEIGKDLEVCYDLDDLEKKVGYYLKHEKERIRIAINGYKKVRQYHTLTNRVEEMLKNIFGDSRELLGKDFKE